VDRKKFISGKRLPRTFEDVGFNQGWKWGATPDVLTGGISKWGFVVISDMSVGNKWMILDVLSDKKGKLCKTNNRDRTIKEEDIYKMAAYQPEINGEGLPEKKYAFGQGV